jgi:ssRNA-specific RNase YbeY (16S rRNA maturation enzyme)
MIAFTNLTNSRRPALKWEAIKNYVLGKDYDLSLVFAGDKLLRELNSRYRHQNKPTDILAFALSEKQGEIFMNLRRVKNIKFLFIHSLLHLKGFRHGVKMNNEGKRIWQATL